MFFALGLLLSACGDDGGSGPDGETDSTGPTDPTGPTDSMSGSSSTSGSTSTASTSSSGTSSTSSSSSTNSSSTTDDESSSESSSSTGEPLDSVCPPGPFAKSPLPDGNVSATAVAGSTSAAYPRGHAEGPVWLDGQLFLSHISGGAVSPSTIFRWVPGGDPMEVAVAVAGTNGLAIDIDGSLIGAAHDDGTISRYDPDAGTRAIIVGEYNGARFNSPNDLTVRGDGTIYFTDPSWHAPDPEPQPVTGVYRVSPDGEVELLDGSLAMPNGITLSPDESTLYVAGLDELVSIPLSADGSAAGGPTQFGPGLSGLDGMVADCAGNLYVTINGDGAAAVLDPGGAELGRITVAGFLTNAAFGGEDRTTLYFTAGSPVEGDAVYSVEMPIPGLPY